MRRSAALATALLGACGGADHLEWDGTAGQPITAEFDQWVPAIDAEIDGAGGHLLLDSGAPLTLVDNDHFAALDDGAHQVDLQLGGMRFPGLGVLAYDVVSYAQTREPPLDGILGGDILTSFSFSLDYAGGRIWLEDGSGEGELPAGTDAAALEAEATVAAQVEGGGVFGVQGVGSKEVGATRLLVRVEAEDLGAGDAFWALVDTGATSSVLSSAIMSELGDQGRPRLDGVTVGTATGEQTAYLTRVWSMRLEGETDGSAAAELTSVPVLVLPDDSLFDSVSAEVGVQVRAVVGGTYLRWFLATLDFPGGALRLRAYREPDHIDPDEFVGLGFDLARSGNVWAVGRVYPGTDADAEGLEVGETVRRIDDSEICDLTIDEIGAILSGFQVGDEVPVEVERDATVVDLTVAMEDLLPDYEAPL